MSISSNDEDIESIDNSTDDPAYKTEDEQVFSDSFDSDFVQPKKSKNKKKKLTKKKMTSEKKSVKPPGEPSSSQPVFDLSQVYLEHSQASVDFRSRFNGLRPGRFVFVTADGKITRTKDFAFKNSQGFVLVFSTMDDWYEFCKGSIDSSVDCSRVFMKHSDVSTTATDRPDSFDTLIWSNPDSVEAEIDLEIWYKLLETYQTGTGWNHRILQNLTSENNTEGKNVNSSEEAKKKEPNSKAHKFNFKLVAQDTDEFVEKNMSPSTIKVTRVAVNLFDNFMKTVHPELLHSTLETVEEFRLPKLTAEFFKVLQKGKDESFNASTLQAYYQGVVRFLKQKRKIHVKNNPDFEECRTVLGRQQKISCENGARPGLNRSHAFPPELLAECWAKGAFGSGDPRALMAALLMHIGTSFGIRGKDELAQIRNEDMILGPKRHDGLPSGIRYSERKTKTRTGLDGQGARPIEFIMTPDDVRPERCPVRLFNFFQSKKPKEALEPDFRFFPGIRNLTIGKYENQPIWYKVSAMGVHTLATIITSQIEAKGIDKRGLKLTGVSTRKTMIDGGLSSGMPGSYVACLAGQKSLASQTHYVSHTPTSLSATNRIMKDLVSGESSTTQNFDDMLKEEKQKEAKTISAMKTSIENPAENRDDVEMVGDSGDQFSEEQVPVPIVPNSRVMTPNMTLSELPVGQTSSSSHSQKKSKHSNAKKSKKRGKKHRRRSPSSSSSSASSSSDTSSSSDSEAEKRKMKKKMKKMKRKMRMMKEKENRPPQGMYISPMIPMQVPVMPLGYPGFNNLPQFQNMPQVQNVPQLQNFGIKASTGQAQVLSQITQHTVAAKSGDPHSFGHIRDETN